jgi:hypothetical protein
MSGGVRTGAFTVLVFLIACDSFLVDPPGADSARPLAVSLQVVEGAGSGYGDLTDVLQLVDQARVQVTQDGATRDTLIPVQYDGGALRARIRLNRAEARGWVEIAADLETADAVRLFAGRSLVEAGASVASELMLRLVPVADTIRVPSWPTIERIGDTQALDAVVLFATGDTIREAVVEWTSGAPAVAEIRVAPGPAALAHSNGVAPLTGTSFGAAFHRDLVVRQHVQRLEGISPADTTIAVGEAFQMRPLGLQSGGGPLLPGAWVYWSASGSVAIDTLGIVTAVSPGTGTIEGGWNNYYSVPITVTP